MMADSTTDIIAAFASVRSIRTRALYFRYMKLGFT